METIIFTPSVKRRCNSFGIVCLCVHPYQCPGQMDIYTHAQWLDFWHIGQVEGYLAQVWRSRSKVKVTRSKTFSIGISIGCLKAQTVGVSWCVHVEEACQGYDWGIQLRNVTEEYDWRIWCTPKEVFFTRISLVLWYGTRRSPCNSVVDWELCISNLTVHHGISYSSWQVDQLRLINQHESTGSAYGSGYADLEDSCWLMRLNCSTEQLLYGIQ